MGKLSLSHEFFDKRRLKAIQADDNQLIDPAFFVGFLSLYCSEEEAEGPGNKGKNGQEKSQEKDKERGEEGKACARADVSFEWQKEEKDKSNKED